jgi:hypothetical protein
MSRAIILYHPIAVSLCAIYRILCSLQSPYVLMPTEIGQLVVQSSSLRV